MSEPSSMSVMGAKHSSHAEPAAPAPTPAPAAPMPATDEPEHCVFPFFDLPAELRDCIYDYALVPESTFPLLPRDRESTVEHIEDAVPEDLQPLQAPPAVLPPLPAAPTAHQQPPQHAVDEVIDKPGSVPPAIQSSVKYRSNINLLLCNKEIRNEYESRAKLAMTLVLKDNENYAFQFIHLPEQVKAVHHVELHIILFCHHCIWHPHSDEKMCQAAIEIVHHRPWIVHLLTQLTDLRSITIKAYLCYDKRGQEKDKLLCESLVKRKLSLLYALPKLKALTLYKLDFRGKPELEGPKEVMLEWDGRKQDVEVEKSCKAGPIHR